MTYIKPVAGPIEFDQLMIDRDAMIHEDGELIDDHAVRRYVEMHREKIFGLQATFFAELRHRLGECA